MADDDFHTFDVHDPDTFSNDDLAREYAPVHRTARDDELDDWAAIPGHVTLRLAAIDRELDALGDAVDADDAVAGRVFDELIEEREKLRRIWWPGYGEQVDGFAAESETVESRNARLLARNAEQGEAGRPVGGSSDPRPIEVESAKRLGLGRPSRAKTPGASVTTTHADGTVSLANLGHDQRAIRAFLEQQAAALKLSFEEFSAPGIRGTRRELLALAVARAVAAGARQEAVGVVIRRTPPRVSELLKEARGKLLRDACASGA